MELLQTASEPAFWKSLFEIIIVNIILSGDNAVVIALAARHLPRRQQKNAVLFGSAAAIVLRVLLTVFAVQLLQYPYLKLVGAALLIWIGAKLMLPEPEGEGTESHESRGGLLAAIRTILIADLVMSVDNVIAVAAAAETGPPQGRIALLIIGLGLSIPLIIVGSQLLLGLMSRWPVIITLGAALLGFVAGEMAVTDPAIDDWFHEHFGHLDYIVSAACAVLVVALGMVWARRLESRGTSA
ncbi:MAG TPA: TerC family protein [Burkholderiaceae bacterium]|nr:TerC family protein [Burkholderiaceae bacterium]